MTSTEERKKHDELVLGIIRTFLRELKDRFPDVSCVIGLMSNTSIGCSFSGTFNAVDPILEELLQMKQVMEAETADTRVAH